MILDCSWAYPPEDLKIRPDEVHVWIASTTNANNSLNYFSSILDASERRRAQQIRFKDHRNRFIVTHRVLRDIVARYLPLNSTELRFKRGQFGKPFLDAKDEGQKLSFNMSHSNQLALYIVAWDRDVGIDLEFERHIPDADEIVERYFSVNEVDEFRSLHPDFRQATFLKYWVRKEAVLKALGDGLSIPLDQIDVTMSSSKTTAVWVSVQSNDCASEWTLQDIAPCCDYVAAIAVEGIDWQLKCWQWR